MNKATIKSEKFGGFAAEKAQAGNLVKLWQQMSITTDHPSFYVYVNQIDMLMLRPARIAGDAITHTFIVQHADGMMDIYTNFDRDSSIQGTFARPINQGDLVHVDDVVDIHRYEIPTISIQPDDAVLCILKLGWKYGLFFDVTRKISEAAIWEGLGPFTGRYVRKGPGRGVERTHGARYGGEKGGTCRKKKKQPL